MRGVLFLLTVVLVLTSCSQGCNSDIVGIYINKFRTDENHYIEIFLDSTYFHYYKDHEGIIRDHKGKWKFSSNKCELLLDNWYYYDSLVPNDWQPALQSVKVYGEELEFVPDSRARHSFFKE